MTHRQNVIHNTCVPFENQVWIFANFETSKKGNPFLFLSRGIGFEIRNKQFEMSRGFCKSQFHLHMQVVGRIRFAMQFSSIKQTIFIWIHLIVLLQNNSSRKYSKQSCLVFYIYPVGCKIFLLRLRYKSQWSALTRSSHTRTRLVHMCIMYHCCLFV